MRWIGLYRSPIKSGMTDRGRAGTSRPITDDFSKFTPLDTVTIKQPIKEVWRKG
jgi:hypothetical protein